MPPFYQVGVVQDLSHSRQQRNCVVRLTIERILVQVVSLGVRMEIPVERVLLRGHLTVVILNDLFWQFLENLGFKSAKDKRHDFEMQCFQYTLLFIGEEQVVFLEGHKVDIEKLFVAIAELFLGLQVAWHEEIEYTPQLQQLILDRGPS
mgnify:FL=1